MWDSEPPVCVITLILWKKKWISELRQLTTAWLLGLGPEPRLVSFAHCLLFMILCSVQAKTWYLGMLSGATLRYISTLLWRSGKQAMQWEGGLWYSGSREINAIWIPTCINCPFRPPAHVARAGARDEGCSRFVYSTLCLTLHYIHKAAPHERRNLSSAPGTFPYKQKHCTDDKN